MVSINKIYSDYYNVINNRYFKLFKIQSVQRVNKIKIRYFQNNKIKIGLKILKIDYIYWKSSSNLLLFFVYLSTCE